RVLDKFVHVDVLREGLADEAGGLELALALDQAAVQFPTRRAAAVPVVRWVGKKWAPLTRHVCLIASEVWSWREESNLQPAVYKDEPARTVRARDPRVNCPFNMIAQGDRFSQGIASRCMACEGSEG